MLKPSRKYRPLSDHLAALEVDEVMLTFADIDHIIRAHLPAGAYSSLFWASTAQGAHTPNYA